MDSIVSIFHVDLKIIIAQIINFGIVFAVLYFYAIKPLGKIMKERSEKIAKGVEDAKANAEVLNKSQKEYSAILAKARSEANEIFQNGKKEAESEKAKILEKTKQEVGVMVENGKKNLESEKVKIIDEAKNEIVSVAIKMAEKIMEKKLDGSVDEKTLKELNNL